MASRTLLIPSFLDDHFPLLRRAFASARWQPVLLTQDQGLADLGLRYIHSDMCYPAVLGGRTDPPRAGLRAVRCALLRRPHRPGGR